MPNWCSTTYHIKGNELEMQALYAGLQAASRENAIENGFHGLWLGNILAHLGYAEEDITSNRVCPCRGTVEYLNIKGDGREITIDTETAWAPMHEPIYWMVEKYAPNATIRWTAIEPGCGIFERNYYDPDVEYLIDNMEEDYEELPDYDFCSEAQLRRTLQKAMQTDEMDIKRLLADAIERWDGLSINKFEVVGDDWA